MRTPESVSRLLPSRIRLRLRPRPNGAPSTAETPQNLKRNRSGGGVARRSLPLRVHVYMYTNGERVSGRPGGGVLRRGPPDCGARSATCARIDQLAGDAAPAELLCELLRQIGERPRNGAPPPLGGVSAAGSKMAPTGER